MKYVLKQLGISVAIVLLAPLAALSVIYWGALLAGIPVDETFRAGIVLFALMVACMIGLIRFCAYMAD